METIRELYRIGRGPSSSHSMGPAKAARIFLERFPRAAGYRVVLFGSLAATGKGHLTDVTLRECFAARPLEVLWEPSKTLPRHPNGLRFIALDGANRELGRWEAYSVGGGKVVDDATADAVSGVYPLRSLDRILERCETTGRRLWEFVEECEGGAIWDFLAEIRRAMEAAIDRGLAVETGLPGRLKLARKALRIHRRVALGGAHFERTGYLAAYAHAVSEENAAGGIIVTAPTCGSCGVLPAVLRFMEQITGRGERDALRALATAGLVGNLVKHNASISGAEVGCQGEVGTACSMAAAAAAQLLGASDRQIEYAAEMGMEHHLGLTCDPVFGLVQIPCIERNAHAATRAVTCADYAILGDGAHRISFDTVVDVMRRTGRDLPSLYRETSFGGLADAFAREHPEP